MPARSGDPLPPFLVQGLSRFEHADELLEPTLPSFRPFGILQPIQNGISIPAVQLLEKALCTRMRLELCLQIRWHRHSSGGRVGDIPAPIAFGSLHLTDPSRRQTSLNVESLDSRAVDLRPLTSHPTRREALSEPLDIHGDDLAVDPTITEGSLQCLGAGERHQSTALFSKFQPDPGRGLVVFPKPRFPVRLRGEALDR